VHLVASGGALRDDDDGVKLHFQETGFGTPIIFVHEFAGDHRSWEPQLRQFGQRYRAITYLARDAAALPTRAVLPFGTMNDTAQRDLSGELKEDREVH
jgi:pimeloyl-ACP methyl ester carboxylesterase